VLKLQQFIPKSLKHKIILTIAVVVVTSGLIISLVVVHWYRISLFNATLAQAEKLAHELSLSAADKILINDLVSLQQILEDQIRSDPAISYLFIQQEQQILTHTFENGVPISLIEANAPFSTENGHIEQIVSEKNERYIDVAWPIFGGKAGVLRVGYSEKPYRNQVIRIWAQIGFVTVGTLTVALLTSLLLARKIMKPLSNLAEAVGQIKEGSLSLESGLARDKEVNHLRNAFQNMLDRVREYTKRLEESRKQLEQKNIELDHAHQQTRISFEIAKAVGAMANLQDICEYLVARIQQIVECRQLTIIIFSDRGDNLLVYTEGALKIPSTPSASSVIEKTGKLSEMQFLDPGQIPIDLAELDSAQTIAAFPLIHQGFFLGMMCVGCPGSCKCVTNDLTIIDLILNQTAAAIRRAAANEDEIRKLRSQIEQSSGYAGLVGKAPEMQIIYKMIENVAPSDATVLIQGESGTGKELVARAVHERSHRRNGPFVVINCSAYPSTLLESELFGHEKGAFTGAFKLKTGRFEIGSGGTVFLDEIGEISPTAQIKLLRVLQTYKIERVGGQKPIPVDVRVIAATNRDLLEEVINGRFREDLFYRLNVIPIEMPPLRTRHNDIPLLAQHFLKRNVRLQDKKINHINSGAMRVLLNYHWPGNVRELENSIEHAVVLCNSGEIQTTDLPTSIVSSPDQTMESDPARTLQGSEKSLLIKALEDCNWNKKETAKRLGIGRSTLYSKLKKYQIATQRRP
jgi:transcriptional regulator with GAF, ATPase, and Fis domain